MPDYEKMYHKMFSAGVEAEKIASEAAELASRAQRLAYQASDIIRKAHKECEELYIRDGDSDTES